MIKLLENLKRIRAIAADETHLAATYIDQAIEIVEAEITNLSECSNLGESYHEHVSPDGRWCVYTQSDAKGCRTIIFDLVLKRQVESYDTSLKHSFLRTPKQVHEMACSIWNNK